MADATKTPKVFVQLRTPLGDSAMDDTNDSVKVTISSGGFDGVVTNAGTFATQIDGVALTALQLIDNIVHTEDDASGGAAVGAGVLAIRDDTLSGLTPAEGDYVPLRVGSTGALHVTGGGGGTEYVEDDAAPANPTGTSTLIKRDDAITSSPVTAEDDFMAMLGTAEGALWVQDFNSDAVLVDAETIAGDTTTLIVDTEIIHSDTTELVVDIEAAIVDLAALEVDTEAMVIDLAAIEVDTETISGAIATDDTTTHSTGTTTGISIMAAATPTDGSVAANDIGSVAMSTDRRLHVDADITASVTLTETSAAAILVDTETVAGDTTTLIIDTEIIHSDTTDLVVDIEAAIVDLAAIEVDTEAMIVDLAAIEVDTENMAPDTETLVTNSSARTTGGHSMYVNLDTSAIATIKTGPGTVYWLHVTSIDATVAYLSFYDAESPTLGTSPDLMFPIPTQGDANGAGLTINFGPHGIQFATDIKIGAATTFNGTTDPGTNVVICNVGFE